MADLGEGARYRAFISYNHRDAAFGRRLHRRLERYRLPRRLVGRVTARGEVPPRIAPIFRDREELSAAGDLTAEVRAALAASGALIVVCSPTGAASPWVAREVELFRALHPDRPVLAALALGEPADAFPVSLRTTDAQGAPIEPLAADFRPQGDGPRLALLKLVAGVVGVGLDELVQRDAQRRLRNVTAVTVAALAAMLAMGALTIFALTSRAEAQRQRGEAENLVEFMLTDLRDRLKGVGRLDVLTAVNQRALRYYADQDVDQLPAASLERRARVLHAMGEDDLTRGDLPAASIKFKEAARTTEALLASAPDRLEWVWAQGQSEHWVGYVAFLRGDRAEARRHWDRYRVLAQRLAAAEPRNPRDRRELGYAEGNLCTLTVKAPTDPPAALRHCTAALAEMEATAGLPGHDDHIAADLINRHAWLADAYMANGDHARAMEQRQIQERLLDQQIAADPRNMDLKETWVVLQRALAGLEVRAGQREGAKARLIAARTVLDEMIAFDPENHAWLALQTKLDASIEYFEDQHG